MSVREFKWVQNNCNTQNGVLCQRKMPKIERKLKSESVVESQNSESNLAARFHTLNGTVSDSDGDFGDVCDMKNIHWRKGARNGFIFMIDAFNGPKISLPKYGHLASTLITFYHLK